MPSNHTIDFNRDTTQGQYIEKAHELLGGKRYFIDTYGCQMNVHDSEKLAGLLQSIGMVEAPKQEEADLILLNTCCVREHAENRVYGNVGALMNLKREKPDLLIGVCGCMMQQEKAAAKLLSKMRHVNLAFGTHNLHELPEILVHAVQSGKAISHISAESNDVVEGVPAIRQKGISAWTTIMYGCDNFCSYCIVPHVRGREKSRAPGLIIEELQVLAASGVREVTLLGQNVNSYRGGGLDFPALLQLIETEALGIQRIRFMTSHPKDLSDSLIEWMAQSSKVCKQIHLPVQSGSDRILALMNRRYTSEHYLGLLQKLRNAMPGIGISSDFIVGFPSETEEDFLQTLRLVEQARLNSSFTFKYSRRSGTEASKMEDQITEQTKKDRLARLNALQAQITSELDREAVGRVERVLFESQSRRNASQVSGRTDSGRMVNAEGNIELIGQVRDVKILKAMANSLLGELI